ncbi:MULTISPECIES: hypothetical protein [unclassified Zobellia]|uniref:hypothetical protein n=1 Tax=unclassified Zobellia TaxID=2620635 RepID=UPI001C069A4B|nr:MULTISPECIES: hypothetical protein [unclassified Zobellia]MBU2974713.1 hypothetical protein [Zobellia sp. B3R18]MDO6820607.1 hypothetical protein [Zobellia sp. 1_MG-2023]
MKYLISIITLGCFAAIIYGFNIQEENIALSHKYIGSGTLGLFLVAMPLFLFTYSKGKKMKDYMLTEENIKKMRANKPEKTDNQDG